MPYRMPNGRFRASKMIAGKRRSKLFDTMREAKAWETMQTQEKWQAEEESDSPILSVCWLDICTAYFKWCQERYCEKTLNEKKLALKRSLQVIKPEAIAEGITNKQALEVLRKVAQTVSGNAANVTRKNLVSLWQWATKYYDFPVDNPFLHVERYAADKNPRYVPPEADFWKVYDVASDLRDKAFLLTLFHTGARVGEIFRLKWDDVDLEGSRIRLGTRKTREGGMEYAWLPMTARLRDTLTEIRKRSISQLVFPSHTTGDQYRHRQHMMERLCQAAGVKRFGFHAIRHLTATTLAYSGLDLPTVQAMLRHHSPNTTARYIQSLGIAPNKIEDVFAESKTERAKVVRLGS